MPKRTRDVSSESDCSSSKRSEYSCRERHSKQRRDKRHSNSSNRTRTHKRKKKSRRSRRTRESSKSPNGRTLNDGRSCETPVGQPGGMVASVAVADCCNVPEPGPVEGNRSYAAETGREAVPGSSGVPDGGLESNPLNVNLPINLHDLVSFISSRVKPDHSSYSSLKCDKNIIPEFDPSVKNQRIDTWLSKVDECAHIYGWSDQQTTHFALPRLVGHAKKWYEGLKTIKYTWLEWQHNLKRAFPSDTNYGALLFEMLEKKFKIGDSLDDYYYDKMILLNACDLSDKKAVDCIIYGLEDRTIRAGASSARFAQPEDLLKYLKDMCRDQSELVPKNKSETPLLNNSTIICHICSKSGHRANQCRQSNNTPSVCFNCKQTGHRASHCPKPIIKCENCQKYGHKTEDCFLNKNREQNNNEDNRV